MVLLNFSSKLRAIDLKTNKQKADLIQRQLHNKNTMPITLDEENNNSLKCVKWQTELTNDAEQHPATKNLKNASWSVPSLRFTILTCHAVTNKSSTRMKVSLSPEKVIPFNENMRLSYVCQSIAINSDPTSRGDGEPLPDYYRQPCAVYVAENESEKCYLKKLTDCNLWKLEKFTFNLRRPFVFLWDLDHTLLNLWERTTKPFLQRRNGRI